MYLGIQHVESQQFLPHCICNETYLQTANIRHEQKKEAISPAMSTVCFKRSRQGKVDINEHSHTYTIRGGRTGPAVEQIQGRRHPYGKYGHGHTSF